MFGAERCTVEFVAYRGPDPKPYYRYLHEDAMGSTIATTDQRGDRRDEYDYTDYGVPLHAPILLDGRWISSVASHPDHSGVSVVTLNWTPPDSGPMLGCEIRFMKENPSSADDVSLTGTVIAHQGLVMLIDDPGNAIAAAWDTNGVTILDRKQSAVYDMREGMRRGVIKSAVQGTVDWQGTPWHGQLSTKIEVEHSCRSRCDPQVRSLREPFEWWFDFSPGKPQLNIQFGPNRHGAKLLRLAPPASTQSGNAVMEVLGHIDPAHADAGQVAS